MMEEKKKPYSAGQKFLEPRNSRFGFIQKVHLFQFYLP